jgi:hypothetical protein
MPFLIQWDPESPHPSSTAPKGGTRVTFYSLLSLVFIHLFIILKTFFISMHLIIRSFIIVLSFSFIMTYESPFPGLRRSCYDSGCHLVDLQFEHPCPSALSALFEPLVPNTIPLPISLGPQPRMIARITTPKGVLQISSDNSSGFVHV